MKTIFTLLCISALTAINAQPTFQASIGGSSFEDGLSVAIAQGTSGFITAGSSSSFSLSFGAYLVKFSNNGTFLWDKIISIAGNNSFNLASIARSSDSTYVLGGTAEGTNENKNDFGVITVDKNGNPLWARTIGGLKDEGVAHVTKTADNAIVIAGSSNSFGKYSKGCFYAAKLDLSGNLLWARTFYNKQSNTCYSVERTADSGCVIVGSTKTFVSGSTPDVYVLKLDKHGKVEWNRAIKRTDSPEASEAEDIVQANDGTYILAGYTTAGASYYTKIYFCRLNTDGSLMWNKTIAGRKEAHALAVTRLSGNTFALAGTIDLSTDFVTIPYVCKFDISGNIIWSQTFSTNSSDLSDINESSDNGIVATGLTTRTSQGDYQMYVAKMDASGNICNQNSSGGILASVTGSTYSFNVKVKDTGTITTVPLSVTTGGDLLFLCSNGLQKSFEKQSNSLQNIKITLNPNPANDYLFLHVDNEGKTQSVQFEIIDMRGRTIQNTNGILNTGINDKKFSIQSLKPGLYVLRIYSGNGTYFIKFMKQ